ncbi:MAG: alanine racemase [Bacteroidales bacterium]|nr:alanine racemase [Bacteroidales bacterium]MCF8404958.1 alanine racemase [Bacteroidales bacterium]
MEIKTPTFIIDEQQCKRNIRKIYGKVNNSGILFRPHFKTHQSAQVGEWFREMGVDKITVSSIQMARYFVSSGWKDILVAFPVNILEISDINQLAHKITLHLCVESEFTTQFLLHKITAKTGIYIKIDTGYHRTGLNPEQLDEIDAILQLIKNSKNLYFTGFLTHSGNSYQAKSFQEIKDIHNRSLVSLQSLKLHYKKWFPYLLISVGDTPSASLLPDFPDIDEIRPGNFIFYDLMQWKLGSCSLDEIAVSVACPVVAKHKSRNEIVIYGGAVHLSKEYLPAETGLPGYGLVALYNKDLTGKIPLSKTWVSRISQEHGIIKTVPENFDKINIGDLLAVIPVHSCLTANLYRSYVTTSSLLISKM